MGKNFEKLSERKVIAGSLSRDDPTISDHSRDHFDWIASEKPESWRTGKSPTQLTVQKRLAAKAAKTAEKKKANFKAKWIAKGGQVDDEGKPYKECGNVGCNGRIYKPNLRRKRCTACIVNSKI